MSATVVFSPAKINLFLAITGRRGDGYHDLVSVVSPVKWGDRLTADVIVGADAGYSLTCDDTALPCDESNLVLKAAQAFRSATGWSASVRFRLEKRIPVGAGLGGGSSNAVAALRALNALAGEPLDPNTLRTLAVRVGSDCALFLHDTPVVMRGRGDRVEALAPDAAERLRDRRLIIFKPAFGISTPWAYAQLAQMAAEHVPGAYVPENEAEARLSRWADDRAAPAAELLFNSMEVAAFRKFIALPVLLKQLHEQFGVPAGMSGSGSACFALLANDMDTDPIFAAIRSAWGPAALAIETRLA